MNHFAFEHTVAKDMALIEWVLRCSGKIGSYVSISQLWTKLVVLCAKENGQIKIKCRWKFFILADTDRNKVSTM